jgi:hypothetical protein
MAIWYILWSFWYSFPFLVCCTKINLATLVVHRTCAAETTTYTFLNKKDEFAWSLIHNEKNNGSLREYFHVAENSEAIAHARICRSSRLTGLQTRKEWSEKIEGQGGDTRGRCAPPPKKKIRKTNSLFQWSRAISAQSGLLERMRRIPFIEVAAFHGCLSAFPTHFYIQRYWRHPTLDLEISQVDLGLEGQRWPCSKAQRPKEAS